MCDVKLCTLGWIERTMRGSSGGESARFAAIFRRMDDKLTLPEVVEWARLGWKSDFPTFRDTPPGAVLGSLHRFVVDAGRAQRVAWADSVPPLQREVTEILIADPNAVHDSAILEYELPMESRRSDVILLVGGTVVVLELKGRDRASQADLDQADAYARDLRCYHRNCANRAVHAVVVPMRAKGYYSQEGGVHVVGPDQLDRLVASFDRGPGPPLCLREFTSADAYCPLPTLVEAARELFNKNEIRRVHRARAHTEPAFERIVQIAHEAARTKSRRLVILTGVPGAGKTLVGLQVVHSPSLADLAVKRGAQRAASPAIFLSGNGPLVEVLQYELRGAGGGGKTFVRDVHEYVTRHASRPVLVPSEHVLVFDEAQRAWSGDKVRQHHQKRGSAPWATKSEPELFVEFADRIPEWCVILALVGGGQEIYEGEEGGLGQWRDALAHSAKSTEWSVHLPPKVEHAFSRARQSVTTEDRLSLDHEVRFHAAADLHRLVTQILDAEPADENRALVEQLEVDSLHLRLTRDLETAKSYLRSRYADDPTARFGLLASSRDRDLASFGVPNDFQSTKRVKLGPWYGDGEEDENRRSCRLLDVCVTEFAAQGLELDGVLLAWGSDLVLRGGTWSFDNARGYKKGSLVRDAAQLRRNAYRVLLTRGRDGTVFFIPPINALDETAAYLLASGVRELA